MNACFICGGEISPERISGLQYLGIDESKYSCMACAEKANPFKRKFSVAFTPESSKNLAQREVKKIGEF